MRPWNTTLSPSGDTTAPAIASAVREATGATLRELVEAKVLAQSLGDRGVNDAAVEHVDAGAQARVALDRTAPTFPMLPGTPERASHDLLGSEDGNILLTALLSRCGRSLPC